MAQGIVQIVQALNGLTWPGVFGLAILSLAAVAIVWAAAWFARG